MAVFYADRGAAVEPAGIIGVAAPLLVLAHQGAQMPCSCAQAFTKATVRLRDLVCSNAPDARSFHHSLKAVPDLIMTGLQNGHIASARQVYAFGCLPRLRQLHIEAAIDVDRVGDEEHAVVELADLPAGLQICEVGDPKSCGASAA